VSTVRVTFLPDNVSVEAEPGTSLLQTALDAGVYIDAECGGTGSCGRCRVLVREGETECGDMSSLSQEEKDQGWQLACQCTARSDVEAEPAEGSRLDGAVAEDAGEIAAARLWRPRDLDLESRGVRFEPPVNKLAVHLAPPSQRDNASDLSRLVRGLRNEHLISEVSVDFPVLPGLGQTLRDGGWNATATVADTRLEALTEGCCEPGKQAVRLLRLEPGDTSDKAVVLTLDIGTTTVWGQLVDINRHQVLATASDYNAQVLFGEDVMARILHSSKEGGVAQLQAAVVRTVNGVLEKLLEEAGIARDEVMQVMAAGNTTMTHLFLGIPPRNIREAPHVPAVTLTPPLRAADIGLRLPPHVRLYSLPSAASYMGGEMVSGVLAAGFYCEPEITLYVDLGTNGEIVLGSSEWLSSVTCSAGPVFEGRGVRCGVRAAPGAVVQFRVDPRCQRQMVVTMAQQPAIGICGVGLIGVIAELYTKGVLRPDGKLRSDLPTDRIRARSGEREYVVVDAANTGTGQDVVLTETDIEHVIRAKACTYAGIMTLLDSVNLTVHDLSRVMISGGLGNFLELEQCIRIGLLPDLPRERFRYIGNGSLLGARLVAVSTDMLEDAKQLAQKITNIELADNEVFMDNYMSAMFLPHTDGSNFPSVRRSASPAPLTLNR
jgi:uncharacterized 2Fe-2S/4Fe-4S cluster protein (DUF4445 family)